MNKKTNKVSGYFRQFYVVVKNTRLPWIWLILSFIINISSNYMLLSIPDLTADLMAGNLTGKALWNSISYYIMFAAVICGQTVILAITKSLTTKNGRKALWKKMLGIRVSYYDENDPSELMSAVTNDLSTAMPEFVTIMVTLLPDIWFVISAFFHVADYDPFLLLSVIVFLPVKYIYMLVYGKLVYKARVGIFTEIGGLTGFLAERICNLPLIKAFTKEDYEREKGVEVNKRLYKANMRQYKIYAFGDATQTLISLFQQFVILVTAVILLQKDRITMQQWVAFFLFSENIALKFDTLVGDWIFIKGAQGAIARTADIYEAEEENINENEPADITAGDIEFKNVSFSYGEKQALTDVSFTIPKGSKTAIVGLCGSGKTTSLSLLERFYAPQDGEIRFGGKAIAEMPLADYRRHFSYVQQNPEVFSGTVKDALTYGITRKVSDEEIFNAAKVSGFAEYLEKQPQGLETAVAPSGNSMSGGQRQRLVLTREFLRNSDVLLFDEPTSALDAATSVLVQNSIMQLFKDKTVIIVTHDLNLLSEMDKIIVLEESRLVGNGNYDELMQSCPLFRNMVLTSESREVTV